MMIFITDCMYLDALRPMESLKIQNSFKKFIGVQKLSKWNDYYQSISFDRFLPKISTRNLFFRIFAFTSFLGASKYMRSDI